MRYLAEEILDVCTRLNYEASILNLSDSQQFFSDVVENFCCGNNSYPLWEFLEDSRGIHDSKGWSWISKFTKDEPVVIFFEQSDDKSMIYIQNGSYFSEILGECFGFVFYVTDLECKYIICFTDHDVLIGAGTAVNWIKSISKSTT